MADNGGRPKASVIIPTYNASGLLRETLRSLKRQQIDPGDFEIIVADDGSSDDTRQVAESFAAKYHYQEDLGFRAGTARNGGAKLAAAPVLVFLDTGIVAGPGLVAGHLAAHEGAESRMIAGYNYGYDPDATVPGLADALNRLPPEDVVEQYRGDPAINDVRDRLLAPYDFDLAKMAVPWVYMFTANCSIRAADFWATGAFEEGFTGWGGEDWEFAYRASLRGIGFGMERTAWAIETPVERDMDNRMDRLLENMTIILEKHREPCVEIGWTLCSRYQSYEPLDWEIYYQHFLSWRERARLDVADEIEAAMRRVPAGDKVAIMGCGERLPASFPGTANATLMDFDADVLDHAGLTAPHAKQHAIGLRTALADRSVDTVIITSRVSGLRDRWNDPLLAEAHRIARSVVLP